MEPAIVNFLNEGSVHPTRASHRYLNLAKITILHRSSFRKLKKKSSNLPYYTVQHFIFEPFWKNVKFLKLNFAVFQILYASLLG